MSLIDLLTNFNLDVAAASGMPWRVLLVGRYNLDPGPPGLYLFTNRKNLPSGYLDNFKASGSLDFQSFMQLVPPVMVEERRDLYDGRSGGDGMGWASLTTPAEVVSRRDTRIDLEKTVPTRLTPESYLWERAAVGDQEEYPPKEVVDDPFGGTLSADERKPHSPERARRVRDRGQRLLRWAHRHVKCLTAFQAKAHHLALSFHSVLAESLPPQMPATVVGAPLPGGLVEAATALLLLPRGDERVDLSQVNWDVPGTSWSEVPRHPERLVILEAVVHAWRDELLGRRRNHDHIRLYAQPLGEIVEAVIASHPGGSSVLRVDLPAARAAYQALTDLLHGKMHLNFLFEYVLQAHMDLPEVRDLFGGTSQNKAYIELERHIKEGTGGLAKPVRRPSRKARNDLVQQIEGFVTKLVDALSAPAGQTEALAGTLAPELQPILHGLSRDPRRADALRRLAGEGGMRRGAFLGTLRILVHDALAPAMYRAPELTYTELAERVTARIGELYVKATNLTREHVAGARAIGAAWAPEVERCVDGQGGLDPRVVEVAARVASDVICFATDGNVVRQMEESLAMLPAAQIAAQLDAVASATAGPAAVRVELPLIPFPSDAERAAVAETALSSSPDLARVQAHATALAGSLTEKKGGTRALGRVKTLVVRSGGGFDGGFPDLPPSGGGDGEEEVVPMELDPAEEAFALQVRAAMETLPPRADAGVLARTLGDNPDFRKASRRATIALSQLRATIYDAYNQPQMAELPTFQREVEAQMLSELILARQAQLGLGREGSFLLRLLLDLIETVDGETESLDSFLKKHSLTEYIDIEACADGFFRRLQNLVTVGDAQMLTVARIMSDVRGMQHLFRHLSGSATAELHVLNATADEYLEWLRVPSREVPPVPSYESLPGTEPGSRPDLGPIPATCPGSGRWDRAGAVRTGCRRGRRRAAPGGRGRRGRPDPGRRRGGRARDRSPR